MLNSLAKSLKERGDRLFAKKKSLDSRNQDIAENFYVERANFTSTISLGDDFASHLMTSYPLLTRRQLGDAIGAMLRPKGKQWFSMVPGYDARKISFEARDWAEYSTGVMRRAMYDRKSMFTRATKEGDHDYAAFGGCCISVEPNRRDTTLLYRNWHLKDVAWDEDSYGQIASIHRNWKPSARELVNFFKASMLHPEVVKCLEKESEKTITVRHVMIRSDEINDKRFARFPWVSLYVDCDNEHVIEMVGSRTRRYVLPRWATVSGSQYPYSPATVIALPDARLLQSMTLTLLDAGERASDPPMIGVAEAIKGDLQLFAGGFTAVDAEYDERLGEVLRPLNQDKSGLPYGMEMADRLVNSLREVFYLNTLSMPPPTSAEMTAFEVGQRVEEYVRQAIPLFEPMEAEYNAELCEMTFETLLYEGAFGPLDNIPEDIQGEETTWAFESPLSESIERNKGQKFLESKAIMAEAIAVDPQAVHVMNFQEALRDALVGIGAPITWQNPPEETQGKIDQEKQAAEATQVLENMQQGADVAQKLGSISPEFAA